MKMGKPLKGLFVSRVSNICNLKERSIQCSNRCILNNLEQGISLCLPSFLPNKTGTEQDTEGQDKKKDNFNNTMLWYPQILSMLIKKSVILPLSEKPLTKSSVQTLPLVTNQTLIYYWHR